MAKKRKAEANRMEEAERNLYSAFCGAANSLSQLYSLAANQHKLAFHAGERHGLSDNRDHTWALPFSEEKFYQWIVRQHEDGSRLTTADIVANLQNEIDYGGDEASASPRLQTPYQHPQCTIHSTGMQISSGAFGQATVGLALGTGHQSDQAKNLMFSNALHSPVRRSLQPYQLIQGGYNENVLLPIATEAPNHEASSPNHDQESSFPTYNDSMEMH